MKAQHNVFNALQTRINIVSSKSASAIISKSPIVTSRPGRPVIPNGSSAVGADIYIRTVIREGYHQLPNITIAGCFAHVRRKFDDALKILPVDQRSGTDAEKGLNYCNRLFALEREYSGLPPEERYQKRLETSLPVAEEFLAWAKTFESKAKSVTTIATNYLVGQWPYLKNFFLDGRLELSNNRAERSIKPFVIGRKNWLFSNTPKGAKASSVIYSIIQTAIENELKPFEYLRLLFETLPNCTTGQIENLMPRS